MAALSVFGLLFLPLIAAAAPQPGISAPPVTCTSSGQAFASCLANVVINPILALLFAFGLLIFIWGIVQFIWGLNSEASHKEEGKQHMFWGLIGMFIMAAAWAILHFIANTIGPQATNLLN